MRFRATFIYTKKKKNNFVNKVIMKNGKYQSSVCVKIKDVDLVKL